MCRYPSSSAQRTALTVVGPLGTCHTPRPRSGIWLPSASTRTRASVVFEIIDIGYFLSSPGEIRDESASQAVAVESAMSFGREPVRDIWCHWPLSLQRWCERQYS